MQQLKVWFTDFWPEWNDEDFITPIIDKHFEIVLDKNNPDVLFHSIFNRLSNTSTYKCKKILYLGENYRPSSYNSNYSISFDPYSETNYRLPLWQVYILRNPKLKNRLFNRLNCKIDKFERFCSFVVSNPSNFLRNGVYHQISQYKRVHSYGKIFTNDLSLQNFSEGRYWRDMKDEFFLAHPHKFMITYENTPYRYYCTEKLMDAFLVGSMPIYLGDPRIGEDWNEEAFINARGNEDLIGDISKIDQDEKLFMHKYEQPVFTDEQKKKLEDNLNNFETWLIDVINK